MAWRFSTGLAQSLLAANPRIESSLNASTIAFSATGGTGGRSTITDTGNGLAQFARHAYVLLIAPGNNNNVYAKVLSSSAGTLEFAASTFEDAAAGAPVVILQPDIFGTIKEIFKNSRIDCFYEVRPADADSAEPGAPICQFTKDGAAFVAGEPTNGLNMGALDGSTLKRAIDPETGASEAWVATPTSNSLIRSCRWYANDVVTGQSISSIRMDGVVASSNADLIIENGATVANGIPVTVTDVSFTVESV
jgi:hypothetical protein